MGCLSITVAVHTAVWAVNDTVTSVLALGSKVPAEGLKVAEQRWACAPRSWEGEKTLRMTKKDLRFILFGPTCTISQHYTRAILNCFDWLTDIPRLVYFSHITQSTLELSSHMISTCLPYNFIWFCKHIFLKSYRFFFLCVNWGHLIFWKYDHISSILFLSCSFQTSNTGLDILNIT